MNIDNYVYEFLKITIKLIGKANVIKNESCNSCIDHDQYKAFIDLNSNKF